jgi:hypothetical protein
MKPNDKKNLHFFDLDNTLWRVDAKVWVIDKEASHKPIIKLDNFEVNRILNGLYRKDNLKIEYNEEEFFISQDILNKVQKKRKIDVDRLGLSWIEFYDKNYINNNHVELLFNNLRHLGKDVNIILLTGRANRERHGDLLNNLRVKMKELGLEIWKIYFVGDRYYKKHDKNISLKKIHVLIEHMVGIKIENDQFVDKKQDWFSNIHFYDDEFMNIDYANDIQMMFERVCKQTKDDTYKYVIERLKYFQPQLYTHLITNNSMNRFKTEVIKLQEPVRFPIKESYIKKFDNFL